MSENEPRTHLGHTYKRDVTLDVTLDVTVDVETWERLGFLLPFSRTMIAFYITSLTWNVFDEFTLSF